VVSIPLKNISQIGSSSQLGKITNVPNHQPDDLLIQIRQADRSRQSLEGLLASMGMAGGMAGVISY